MPRQCFSLVFAARRLFRFNAEVVLLFPLLLLLSCAVVCHCCSVLKRIIAPFRGYRSVNSVGDEEAGYSIGDSTSSYASSTRRALKAHRIVGKAWRYVLHVRQPARRGHGRPSFEKTLLVPLVLVSTPGHSAAEYEPGTFLYIR